MDPLEDPEGLDDTAGAQRRALAEHARFVDENLKRNYTANFIHGVLGMTGFRLIYAPTIIPAYLLLLTGSTAAVGLGTALLQLGATISPIASGSRIEHRSHILPYAIGVGSMMRLMILGLALTGYFLTGNVLLVATFACFVLLGFFTGAQRVAFQMLMSKLIPIRKRGRLQGYRNFAGGLIAALLAWAAGNYLIADKWLGNGYATTFLFAFLLTSAGLVVLKTMIREPAAPVSRPQMPMMQRIRQFPELLQDRDFAWFLAVQCFSTMARVGAPFWTIYAGTQLGLDGALIGGLSFVFLGSDTLSNVLWGPLGDRFGFKIIYVLALCSSISGVTLLILGSTAVPIYAAFVLLGVGGSGWMLASTTMVLEFGEPQDTPMRLAFVTTLEGAIAASGPVIAGLLVAVSGFQPLFFIVLAAQIAALLLLIVKVREPRHRVGAV
ncbi:MFS transporter [Citromicrobium sp. RCC1885]|uniref:MFS transporter n=1 Tax=unclassified Citromicrobium TaxID=2630544 RepID=UPI0006C8F7D2|nr:MULTISPECIES: MFS transporter [unclassified Citromicrobium]KPM25082.1 MFS transporter [Citromicrobium sp. RCC1885]KPM28323.1 MFS transporter [Citromicrobium sp. RCC1878]MAO03817.1 MFS transporter [Citromicrobium sp.]OAM10149.1 MFS transporter [Citromicrobium sp. RCC1897]